VRPSIRLDALVQRMQSKNLNSLLVTTPDGKLVGLVLRSQAEDRLNSSTR
jgi:CBS domain-containing protein